MTALKELCDGALDLSSAKLYVGVHDDVVIIGRSEGGETHQIEAYYIAELPSDGCWSLRYGNVTIQVGREVEQTYKDREVDPSEIGYE